MPHVIAFIDFDRTVDPDGDAGNGLVWMLRQMPRVIVSHEAGWGMLREANPQRRPFSHPAGARTIPPGQACADRERLKSVAVCLQTVLDHKRMSRRADLEDRVL